MKEAEKSMEEIIFSIIIHGGNARAKAYDALKFAQNGDFAKAQEALNESEEELRLAHNIQTDIIQKEAGGTKVEVTVLFVHAQDHLMTAVSEKGLIENMIELYKRIEKLEKRGGIKMEGLKIAVIGGGSSYTPELVDGFIKRKEELNVKEIHLVDIPEGEEKLNIVGNLVKRMVKKAGLDTKIVLTLDRKEAIKDADYVVTQFRVGGLEARARDERIPLKYNVLGQETTGPGGFAKALRTIPVIMDICKDIEELSPEAWLINFANPAGLIAETVLRYTNVKAIGLCNVPVNMKNTTAQMFGVEPERIRMDFMGLNHLSWAYKVYLDGRDITSKVVEKNFDDEALNMKNIPNLKWNKDYLMELNMLPSSYLRYYYLKDEMVQDQIKDVEEGKGTRAEQVMKIEGELFELYDDKALDIKPPQLEKRGGAYYSEAAVSLISAIHNDKKEIHTVNIRNNGAISNMEDDVVIECNAFIDKTGATPIVIGEMPPTVSGLVHHTKAYELLTAEVGITGNYEKALLALSTNSFIPSVTVAKKLLDDILEANKKYLPQFNKEQ